MKKKKDFIKKSLGELTLICTGFKIILKLDMFVGNQKFLAQSQQPLG